jgi:hypothetical protein
MDRTMAQSEDLLMERVACFVILLILSAATVQAQQIGDPRKGAGLARDTCSHGRKG